MRFASSALLLVAVAFPNAVVQAQELEWITSANGIGVSHVAADADGSSYVTGPLRGAVTFGAGEANETVLIGTADAFEDFFVARFAPDGSLLWATSSGAAETDTTYAIAADGNGNSYVTGYFIGPITFGAGEANETTFVSAGWSDVFVAKYDPHGRLLWATTAGGTGAEEGYGIAADPSGNSYVTGKFTGTATFGVGEAAETALTTMDQDHDVFVAKYDPHGRLLWVTKAGGAGFDVGNDIATDGHGNSHVAGITAGAEVFVAKYASDGSLLWTTSAASGEGHGVTTDGDGNAHVIATAGVAGRLQDIFVSKYAPDGTLLWVTSAGGSGSDFGHAIAADGHGNVYVTGQFEGDATFGAGEANETVLFADTSHALLAKYASDGGLLWATSAGGSGGYGSGVATDGQGNGYWTGVFGGTAVFGEGQANETVLTGPGIFIAKYAARAVDDGDGDGVADVLDLCPATRLPEAVPTSGRLLRSHFAITDAGPAFSAPAPNIGKRPSFTVSDTRGCSCEQIIDYLGLGKGHRKHGCSLGVMRTFIAGPLSTAAGSAGRCDTRSASRCERKWPRSRRFRTPGAWLNALR